MNEPTYKWDLFISHADEDKKDVVRPLVTELRDRQIKVWFDEDELFIGDKLREKIDKGLLHSRFGVIILSENYFNKTWPKAELEGAFSLERQGRLLLLPIWHNISRERVTKYSPIISNRVAADTSQGIEAVASSIADSIRESKPELDNDNQQTNDCARKVPVVLTGCGWWARQRTVLPLKSSNKYLFDIVGITELKEERKEFVELITPEFERHDISLAPYYANLTFAINECRKTLGSESPLSVIINTPNQLHDRIAAEALNNNCHVYSERPINRHPETLRNLVSIAENKGLVLFNGVQRRLEAPFKYIFDSIRNRNDFGELSSIRCVLASGRDIEGWRRDPILSGGGIVIDEGYHLLDAAAWLIEAAYPNYHVEADGILTSTNFEYDSSDPSLKVEIEAVGIAKMPHNLRIYFDLSYKSPLNSVFEMLEARDEKGNRIRLMRDLSTRSKKPGEILHQRRDSKVIRKGFVSEESLGIFTFDLDIPQTSANNTGPLKEFIQRVSAISEGRTVTPHICEAKYVQNTQELIAAIYSDEH